jgi:hypothetical protein
MLHDLHLLRQHNTMKLLEIHADAKEHCSVRGNAVFKKAFGGCATLVSAVISKGPKFIRLILAQGAGDTQKGPESLPALSHFADRAPIGTRRAPRTGRCGRTS